MVTKSKITNEKKKGRVEVGKLPLNKETVKNLSAADQKKLKGGQFACVAGITIDHKQK